MLWFLQLLNSDYQKSIAEHHYKEELLAEETLKLYSIINSKHKILETFSKYSQLLSISSRQNCLERSRMAARIVELTSKYNLNEPITVNIQQEFSDDINSAMEIDNNTIKIKNYGVTVKFAIRNFDSFMDKIKEIYSYMPENTVILSTEVRREDVLAPATIYKLSTGRPPDLVFVKLNMRIREIAARASSDSEKEGTDS